MARLELTKCNRCKVNKPCGPLAGHSGVYCDECQLVLTKQYILKHKAAIEKYLKSLS